MMQLGHLVRKHRFYKTYVRTNLGGEVKEYAKSRFLKTGIFSNCLHDGPILEHVQTMLPEVNQICLNFNVQCGPHRDSRNSGVSHICFFGEYEGGDLVLETGEIFSERGVWHTFNGQDILHWNTPHIGDKWSVVAYQRAKTRAPNNKRLRQDEATHIPLDCCIVAP